MEECVSQTPSSVMEKCDDSSCSSDNLSVNKAAGRLLDQITQLILSLHKSASSNVVVDDATVTRTIENVMLFCSTSQSKLLQVRPSRDIHVEGDDVDDDNPHSTVVPGGAACAPITAIHTHMSVLLAVAPVQWYQKLVICLFEAFLGNKYNGSPLVHMLCYELLLWAFRLEFSIQLPCEKFIVLLGRSVQLRNGRVLSSDLVSHMLKARLFQHLYRRLKNTDRRAWVLDQLEFKHNAYLWSSLPAKLIPKRMLSQARNECELLLHRLVLNSASSSATSTPLRETTDRCNVPFMFKFYLQFLWDYLQEKQSLDALKPMLTSQVKTFSILQNVVLQRCFKSKQNNGIDLCSHALLYAVLPLSVFFLYGQDKKVICELLDRIAALLLSFGGSAIMSENNVKATKTPMGLQVACVKMLLVFVSVFAGQSNHMLKDKLFAPLCAIFQALFRSNDALVKLLTCKVFVVYSARLSCAPYKKFEKYIVDMVHENERSYVAYYMHSWIAEHTKATKKTDDDFQARLRWDAVADEPSEKQASELWEKITDFERTGFLLAQ